MNEPTEKEFLKHVEAHTMEMVRDDGVNRHLRFRQPATTNRHFDLITWPGFLCFTGDMGTFVFSRILDMFDFFRSDYGDDKLHINLGYWHEKLQAIDRVGAEKFSPELFRKNVLEYVKGNSETGGISRKLKQAVEDDVLRHADDGEFWAMHAVSRFEYEGHHPLSDFYEVRCQEYTYYFVWCCYAMVWGIKQYDDARLVGSQSTATDASSALLTTVE